jgi:hypothetical protein
MQNLSRSPRREPRPVRTQAGRDFGGCGLVNSAPQSGPLQARPGWHALFADTVRFALAPLILFLSGFFTANFVISGQYTWPRTSRVLVLTLTVVILSYEFVYKEQLSRHVVADRAKSVLLYSCVVPYLVGWVLMLVLWKL